MIELYDTFSTQRCLYELIFGDFNDQPIPSKYYNLLNNDNDYGNNIPGITVDNYLLYNEVMEDAFMPDNEDIKYEIIIDGEYSLASVIDPLKNNSGNGRSGQ